MSLALVRQGLREVSRSLDAIEAPPELSVVEERETWLESSAADWTLIPDPPPQEVEP